MLQRVPRIFVIVEANEVAAHAEIALRVRLLISAAARKREQNAVGFLKTAHLREHLRHCDADLPVVRVALQRPAVISNGVRQVVFIELFQPALIEKIARLLKGQHLAAPGKRPNIPFGHALSFPFASASRRRRSSSVN